MKTIRQFAVLAFATLILASCSTHPRGFSSPPGHQKKAAGSKSAKSFAPGQQKKNR
ncbi:MAG: hypothetical protein ABW007_13090 [Chitinophagaceae bacterium]